MKTKISAWWLILYLYRIREIISLTTVLYLYYLHQSGHTYRDNMFSQCTYVTGIVKRLPLFCCRSYWLKSPPPPPFFHSVWRWWFGATSKRQKKAWNSDLILLLTQKQKLNCQNYSHRFCQTDKEHQNHFLLYVRITRFPDYGLSDVPSPPPPPPPPPQDALIWK